MSRYKYLGKKVKDRGRRGLDKISEYRDIARAIVKDYRKGKITKKTAQGRLLLLYRLTFKKNNKKIAHISNKKLTQLRRHIRKLMKSL